MSIEYQVRLEDPLGNHLQTFANFIDSTDGGGAGIDYVLNVGSDASGVLTVPSYVDPEIFFIDGRLIPMRSIHGRTFYNDNGACYLIRKKTIVDNWYRISGRHSLELIDRRAVAYPAGSSFADKSNNFAGNQIKAYVRENIGNLVNTANRDGDDTGADLVSPGYLLIEPDKGDGASVPKTTDRGSMLGVIQDIASDSTADGTYMNFGMLYGSDGKFSFVTRESQWGVDRRAGTADQLILSPEEGNMAEWKLVIDHTDEVTFAIAGGRGQNDERIIATAIDTDRMNVSPFNRRERYYDATSGDTVTKVQAIADARLREGEPKITLECNLVETQRCIRGIHFDLGDIVTARVIVHGHLFQFDFRIDTIYVSVRRGRQDTRAILSSPI